MIIKEKYLNDASFLMDIAKLHIKDYFVKITVLDWLENEIEDIEGKVLNASLNVDGNSIIRRTATLSVVIDDTNNNITSAGNLLSINKKINLQIGFINTTDKYVQYEILWFPLGLYVITDNSISYSNTGLVASLQLKDKMCLLNGECGGTLPATTIFDIYTTIDENGAQILERPTIYQIIQELVNHFGGEQLGKIIISDLDTRVKQVMQWTGTSPLYVYKINEDQYHYTLNPNDTNLKNKKPNWPKQIFEMGEDIGYIYTDFTYPGELIGNAGNTITDILQQIKTVLGNYEYFYDIDGNFIFREKKNYLNNAQSKYILDSINNRQLMPDYINSLSELEDSTSAYLIDINNGTSAIQFNDSFFISSYNNTPKYSEIKNDFMVWGIRTTSQGVQIPIRYHLAIDKKPVVGNVYYVLEYQDETDGIKKWYYPCFYTKKDNFPKKGAAGVFYCIGNPFTVQEKEQAKTNITTATKEKNIKNTIGKYPIYIWGEDENKNFTYIKIDSILERIVTKDWRTQLLFQGLVANVQGTENNYYFAELFNEWPKIYDIRNNEYFKETTEDTASIDFFLDFIDAPSSSIAELGISNIGRRTKVLDLGKNVNCIFEAWIPDLILIESGTDTTQNETTECQLRGQPFYQVESQIYQSMQVGGIRYSAYEEIRQLLHEYTKYNQSISFQMLPMYHLQPNTRITVNNLESNIYGDYIIDSLSLSLDNSSMLTINATRVPEKI